MHTSRRTRVKTASEQARELRERRRRLLLKRERLAPAIRAYDAVVEALEARGIHDPAAQALEEITGIFRGSYNEVLSQIEASGKTGIQAQNAIKRSAGTNFQGVCEYAVSRWLDTSDLPVAINTNAPKAMQDELTIHGVDNGVAFSVQPDIDMCLWVPDQRDDTPIIFVSAKSSLVDRAGQAARWKMYLDMNQTNCQFIPQVSDCPVRKTKVQLQSRRRIYHCIVTANIYKIDTTHPQGELASGQCRNNTFMFEHRYTTRNDPAEERPTGWLGFNEFPDLIESIFRPYATQTSILPATHRRPR